MSFARQQSRLLCLLCQSKSFTTSVRRLANEAPKPKPIPTPQTTSPGGAPLSQRLSHPDLADAPRSYGKRTDKFTPVPLARPIGLPYPPEAGQNTGVDRRSVRERRDDFVDYGKHLDKRQKLKDKMARPYFRDWTNLRFHKGKTFLAPPRPFKGDLALYFPNLSGQTLSKTNREPQDTTPALEGRISVVSLFSGMWAENQCKTFVSAEHNPAVAAMIAESGGRAQHVHINVEEDPLKAFLIKMWMGSLRRQVGGEENWGRYFVVRKGISDEIRECIGLLNSKVGYTYLVDGQCRIRWAGSGDSQRDERDDLIKAIHRLLTEGGSGDEVKQP